MSKFLISFIIPTLNEKRLIPDLLFDLTEQEVANFEVVVVDAQSIDGTKVEVLKFAKLLPLTIIETKKRNVAYQKNLGAKRAKGEYLVFIDADCRIPTSFTSELYKSIKENKRLIYLPKVEALQGTDVDKRLFEITNYAVVISQVLGKPIPTAGCLIFEKGIFKYLGGFDPEFLNEWKIGEDHDIILRARNLGVVAKCLKMVNYKFSLRRFKKEGRIKTIRKYIVSAIGRLTDGEYADSVMEYHMGGHYFDELDDKTRIPLEKKLMRRLKKFKDIIFQEELSP